MTNYNELRLALGIPNLNENLSQYDYVNWEENIVGELDREEFRSHVDNVISSEAHDDIICNLFTVHDIMEMRRALDNFVVYGRTHSEYWNDWRRHIWNLEAISSWSRDALKLAWLDERGWMTFYHKHDTGAKIGNLTDNEYIARLNATVPEGIEHYTV